MLTALRERGLRTGLLSNTHWPRAWHEHWLERDGVLDLLDARVYTSDLEHLKPHPEAFRAAMAAVGVTRPQDCVYVGDRPFDDVYGAHQAGLHTVLIPNSDVPAFAQAEPDATIRRLGELIAVIDRW